MVRRRDFLGTGAAALASVALLDRASAQHGTDAGAAHPPGGGAPPASATNAVVDGGMTDASVSGGARGRVIVPNGAILPSRVVGGVRVFHLVAEPVDHEFTPGLRTECWGYNGRTPGPVIEATEGERVRIYVTNRLPEPTTVHWHGLFVPSGMDGVAGLSQPPIPVGATFRYEFDLTRPGTFMYHSHFDEMVQIALGAVGMFVVHPRTARGASPDRDFAIMLHEWHVPPGARRPNPLAMNEWNVLTMNGKAYPATDPLMVRRGERVRVRLGNLGPMDHHPIHLHGYAFRTTATDGGPIPAAAQWPETTVLVPVGATRDIEFVADALGDWAFHCHMTHHVMNQMGHEFPNMTGARRPDLARRIAASTPAVMPMGQNGMGDMAEMQMPLPDNSVSMRASPGPQGAIDMGGMFTVVKVRESLEGASEWWTPPAGTLAREASAAELAADGVHVD